MSFTEASNLEQSADEALDRAIDETDVWLAEIAAELGTADRLFAYRAIRGWLHALRDRLPVPLAEHVAAQLPELLRWMFYDGWNPCRAPAEYGRAGYLLRFAVDGGVRVADVPRAASQVARVMRHHVRGDVLDAALNALPPEIRELAAPAADVHAGSVR